MSKRQSRRPRRPGLKVIAKAITKTKRSTKRLTVAITICLSVIIIIGVLGFFGFASIKSSAFFLNLFVAVVGGVIVFFGLWIEKDADEEKEKHPSPMLSRIRLIKLRSEIGWWILMAGIVVEIGDAGWAAYELWDMDRNNNPLNKQVALASATVSIKVSGTNFNDWMVAERFPNNRFTQLMFMKAGDSFHKLALICTKSEMFASNDHIWWHLEFSQFLEGPSWNLHGDLVRSAGEWNVSLLHAPFVPSDSDVLDGEVRLVLNGWNNRTYSIPPQKPDGTAVINVPTKDIPPIKGTSNSFGVRVIGTPYIPTRK